jgi:acetyl esterase/lipase
MPVGYVVTTLLVTVCVASALAAPRPEHSRPWRLSFALAYLVNELPFATFVFLVAAAGLAAVDGDLDTPGGAVGLALSVLSAMGLVVIVRRALRTREVLDAALVERVGVAGPRRLVPRARWWRIVCWPFPWWFRRGLGRTANLRYGPEGRYHRLDVFRPTRRPARGPVLVHFHGGAFRMGRKNLDGQPLVNRFVADGWVCVSANYRIGRGVRFPEQLVDAKRAIAWTKAHAAEWGADPSQVFVAGSSAGAHLATLVALTANDARFQPGFEEVDARVLGAIGLYGYYGPIATSGPPSSPRDYLGPHAPPCALVHGDRDTLVVVEDVRSLDRELRARSRAPVLYAELPDAHHNFDLFHSIRVEAVIDALDVFTRTVLRERAPSS